MARRLLGTFLLLVPAGLLAAGCMATVWAPLGPPDAVVDVHGAIPGPGYVWIDGYWEWHKNWVWAPGHWAVPPHAGAVWRRPYWEHRESGWRFHSGYWH